MNSREKNFPLEFEENLLLLKINPKKIPKQQDAAQIRNTPYLHPSTDAPLHVNAYIHFFFFLSTQP